MLSKPSEPLHEEQDDPEIQFGADLHSICVDAQLLMESDRITPSLYWLLGEVRRAIKGCRWCHQILGERHTGGCPTGGRRVLVFDLAEPEDKFATARPHVEPF